MLVSDYTKGHRSRITETGPMDFVLLLSIYLFISYLLTAPIYLAPTLHVCGIPDLCPHKCERNIFLPLITSCRSISLWVSPATTSLPTVCCQFWASGSGSRSDSWPRSSSRRWGRSTSVQNPKLGDSMLLKKNR